MPGSSGSSATSNPFGPSSSSATISAATVQLINIRQHVPIILDLTDSNYSSWSTFFMVAFRKFGLLDHIDGTVDARLRLDDTEWSQIDYGVVSWLYTTVSQEILDIILKPDDTAYAVWAAIHNIFLGNHMQRAVYAQQEFHSLYQGDLSITAYFRRLKQLADTLRDVGSPVSDQALVLNMLRGLSSKFSHAISNMTLGQLPTFINARSYLLGEERRLAHTAAMEAATVNPILSSYTIDAMRITLK